MRQTIPSSDPEMFGARRGSMAPAMMVALVVVISAVALTLDRLWLQAAQAELQTAAEIAALGAGRHLASDDLLRPEADPQARIDRARNTAVTIAGSNQTAGQSVELDGDPQRDIRFGRLMEQKRSGRVVFVETDNAPTSVVVRARHSRSRNNPVATFFQGFTGEDGGDVAALAEATLDNRIPGFEPLDGAPIPILPFAILRSAPEDSEQETWRTCIDERSGRDDYGYDEATGKVTYEPDNIPEITLRPSGHQGDPEDANVHLIVPQPWTSIPDLARQVATGWNHEDLPQDHPQLRVDQGRHEFDTVNGIPGPVSSQLSALVGECRIVLLYDEFTPAGKAGGRIQCVQFVAGRILSLDFDKGGCAIVFQPGVMTTRAAILVDETETTIPPEQLANAYVYKLRLTQ